MVIFDAEVFCLTVSAVALGIVRAVPGRTRIGSLKFGLAAINSCHRKPLPKCSLEIFQRESPVFTVTVPVASILAGTLLIADVFGATDLMTVRAPGVIGTTTIAFGTMSTFGAAGTIVFREGTSDRENGSRIPIRGMSNFGATIGDFFAPSAG